MNKPLLLAFALVSVACGKSITDQCQQLATAACAWAYRCPSAGYPYIDRGSSEADCVSRFGFSGAPAPGCENVTSEAQACSPPKQFQSSQVDPCVAEMNVATCSSSGPLTGAGCSGLCK